MGNSADSKQAQRSKCKLVGGNRDMGLDRILETVEFHPLLFCEETAGQKVAACQ